MQPYLEELLKKRGIQYPMVTGAPQTPTPLAPETPKTPTWADKAIGAVSPAVKALMAQGKIVTSGTDLDPGEEPEFVNRETGITAAESTAKPEMDASGMETTEKAITSQREVDDQDRERRRLQGLAQMAEGLGNMKVVSTGHVLFGRDYDKEPFIAEGIRNEMDRQEDELTPSEREFFGQYLSSVTGQKVDIPKTMTRSRLEKFMPVATNAASRYRLDPYSERRLDLQEQAEARRQAQGDRSLGLRERGLANQTRSQELREMATRRLSTEGQKRVYAITDGLQGLRHVRGLFDSMRDEVGPIQGRISKALIKAGYSDAGNAALNASTVDALAMYVRSISGAQVHVSEFDRLKTIYPDITQSPEQFEALLDNMEEILMERANSTFAIEESQGRNVEPVKQAIGASQEKPAPGTPATTANAPVAPEAGPQMMTIKKGNMTRTLPAPVATIMIRDQGWTE